MAEKKEPPRRTFMKQAGTGIVGSAVITETLSAQGAEGEEKKTGPHQGSERLELTVNGKRHTLMVRPSETLVEVLRGLRYVRYAAWIAERWDDPAFPRAFPDWGSERYWEGQIADLYEQVSLLEAPQW